MASEDQSGDGGTLGEEEQPGKKRLLLETHPGLDLTAQSTKLDGGRRISALLGKVEEAWKSPDPLRIKTCVEAFVYGKWMAQGGPCVGQRGVEEDGEAGDYVWLSYEEVWARAQGVAKGLAALGGLRQGQLSSLGLCLRNCPDWLCLELAAWMGRRLVVPMYPTTEATTLMQMLRQTALEVLAVDSVERAVELAEACGSGAKKPALRHIVYCPRPWPAEAGLDEARKKLAAAHLRLLSLSELLALGAKGPELKDTNYARSQDLAVICYTSGTEGDAKGVLLSQANLVASASNVGMLVGRATKVRAEDCVFSWIPLAHIQQRCVELAVLCRGARIGYLHSKVADYHRDMKALRPTILVTTPRLLNDLHRSVYKDENGLTKGLLKLSVWWKNKRGKDKQDNRYVTRGSLADKVLLKKRQEALGGALRLIVTGSAPVQAEVVKHLRLIFGCVVVQGYGTTETSGAVTLTNEADLSLEHQGAPVPAAVLKLRDIPEMGYSAIDERGEVMVSGALVGQGYLRSVHAQTGQLSATALAEAGWFRTGDVGEWTDTGCLRIVDRVKNIFKLPQGIFVAPEKLESAYRMCKYMEQVFVTGDPLKPHLVAVAVPDMEMMAMCAKEDFGKEVKLENGELGEAERVSLCKDTAVRAQVLNELQKAGKAFGLLPHEMLKNVHLRPEKFSVENGLLSAEHKLRRHELRRRFHKDIERLFHEIASNTAPTLKISQPTTVKTNKSTKPPAPAKAPARSDLL